MFRIFWVPCSGVRTVRRVPGQLALFGALARAHTPEISQRPRGNGGVPAPARGSYRIELYTLLKEPRRSEHIADFLRFQVVSPFQSYQGREADQAKCHFLPHRSTFHASRQKVPLPQRALTAIIAPRETPKNKATTNEPEFEPVFCRHLRRRPAMKGGSIILGTLGSPRFSVFFGLFDGCINYVTL